MAEPLSHLQRSLREVHRERPRKSFSGQRMVSARQPVNHVQPSAAILDNPVNGTRLSVAKEEGTNDVDLVWETGMSFPDTSSRDYPGFSSYDEAEETRSRLPVQNLDLVPTIFSRSGTPIMLKAKFWLDPMMTYQPGWHRYESTSSIDLLGNELAARAYLDRADGSGRKHLAFVRDIWAIHEDEEQKVWHASQIHPDDLADLDDPIGRGFYTGGGPSWPTSSHVTLLAKAIDSFGEFFIKSYPTPITEPDFPA